MLIGCVVAVHRCRGARRRELLENRERATRRRRRELDLHERVEKPQCLACSRGEHVRIDHHASMGIWKVFVKRQSSPTAPDDRPPRFTCLTNSQDAMATPSLPPLARVWFHECERVRPSGVCHESRPRNRAGRRRSTTCSPSNWIRYAAASRRELTTSVSTSAVKCSAAPSSAA